MKADLIVKNARIYTENERQPWAEAFAVKDGKFIYVGPDKGIADYDADKVIDAEGKFIMPAFVDSHVHVGASAVNTKHFEQLVLIAGKTKKENLEAIQKHIEENPETEEFYFYMGADSLNGERLTRDELDQILPDRMLHIMEFECHSCWVNTPKLRDMGIDEYAKDMSPGLSYYERDEDGRVNGRIFEFCHFTKSKDISIEEYAAGLDFMIEYWKKMGVVAGFDAGNPLIAGEEKFYKVASARDKAGELPVYIDSCKYIYDPEQLDTAVAELKNIISSYTTENFRPCIMKMMFDGTLIGANAGMYEPYATGTNGATLLETERLCSFLLELNENGIDFHAHTVGERAIGTVLDAVEMARKEVGDAFTIQVTCAHIETIPDEMLPRFAELSVFANFTPHWFGGNCVGSIEVMDHFIGQRRSRRMYRANSLWNTGATVTFASDSIAYIGDMKSWNPYMGIEMGMTRQDSLFGTLEDDYSECPVYPGNEEKLSLAQLLKGYTINAAKQMRLDDKVGSIETGKDGSFLIFEQNLFDVNVYEMHKQLPRDVFFKGEKVN